MVSLSVKYGDWRRHAIQSGLHIRPEMMIAALVIAAVLAYIALSLVFGNPLIPILAAIGLVSLIKTLPDNLRAKRMEAIERNLPDAMKQIASTMRAGATVERALQEIATFGYGPLSEAMAEVLKEIREGKPFEAAFQGVANDSGSDIFQRAAVIIVDARRAGAGLADVMDAIADDVREVFRAKRERLSRTTMFSAFLTIAALLIAPVIFGMVLTIVGFVGRGVAASLSPAEAIKLSANLGNFDLLFSLYLGAQAIFSTVALGIVRFGKPGQLLIQLPFFALAALLFYEIGKFMGGLLIGGVI